METTVYEIDTVLFERGPGEWVAQCLQYDIGAQASNIPDLLYELQRSLVGHIVISYENRLEPLESLPPAPEEYWHKWRQAEATVRTVPAPFRMPKTAPRIRPRYKIAA